MAQTTRELVLARRKAMSTSGKAGLPGGGNANPSPVRASARLANSQQAAVAAPAPVITPASTVGAATSPSNTSRAASLARRQAMSSRGKANLQSKDRTRSVDMANARTAVASVSNSDTAAEKKDCGCGCGGEKAECKTEIATQSSASLTSGLTMKKPKIQLSPAKAASLARRQAMSARGKAGVSKNGMSPAQTARAGNPDMSSRDLSKAVREQRSKSGKTGKCDTRPCGRVRPKAESKPAAAQDAPWKVGASETVSGQTVTGTMVGRIPSVTGDEPSTCRGITGTEYLGADIFRDFCQKDPSGAPRKVTVTSTSHGNTVSGDRIGRASNVTGNEPGTCKIVTGDEYISADQSQAYCGEFMTKSPRKVSVSETGKGKAMTGSNVGRSEKVTGDEAGMNHALTGTQYTQPEETGAAPSKVGKSATLSGGSVTGTMVGRREKMTGDEAGSCRDVTGDDYVGQEQYSSFCNTAPAPRDHKVGVSKTGKGMTVTGTMTDRESKVTGNEPGSCKAVSGTPYASEDAYVNFCQAEDAAMASMRTKQLRATPGMPMTGIQPGVGGVMTGNAKGECEPLTGTPYVGADQFASVCPAKAADTASSDFPQPMSGAKAPWQEFSVNSPSGGAQQALGSNGITGNQYEQGHITGPFGMATGKVTGTEEARFGHKSDQVIAVPETAEMIDGRVKSRISGEGMDAGTKITGDDWDRGEHVTGTEGMSATRRNPTIRSIVHSNSVMHSAPKRNEEIQAQVSKVTGSSGNTEKGSLITYSGGARG